MLRLASSVERSSFAATGSLKLSAAAVPPLRFQGKQGVMQYQLNPISAGVPGAIVELKTIYLPVDKLYLGLYVERFIGKFPEKSGWSLHGPGNFTRYQAGNVLQAIYPRDFIPVEGRGSLDRNPSTPGENDLPSSPVGFGDATPE
jgi:hypothetical protein